ncbi:MAG: histidinol-phosphate transaminase [Thermoleophilia bacterium]|nr:histidinol-phosphate transaminase [Thermoleophilia bacterium]
MTQPPFLFRPAIADLVPYQPGKPAEELARERGLDRVVKLASNEGPWGPLPAAAAIMGNAIEHLNRYPDGSCVLLREALAELHGVTPDRVAVGHGADAIINNLSMAMLEPGDEVVFGWPSFPSYLLDARKMGAVPVPVPLDADHRYDLDAMLAAVTDKTRIVYLCNPNNPTGTMRGRADVTAFLDALPANVLPVLDEAYFDYVGDADYPDGISEFAVADGRHIMVLRTFSKIYGLAGVRVGYAIAPAEVVYAIDKVRNAFDVTTLAQEAARASIVERHLLADRIAANAQGRAALTTELRELGLTPVPSVANFVCVVLDTPGGELYESLLDLGVIVRPLAPFGMQNAVRVTVGTPEETRIAIDAFRSVLSVSV